MSIGLESKKNQQITGIFQAIELAQLADCNGSHFEAIERLHLDDGTQGPRYAGLQITPR